MSNYSDQSFKELYSQVVEYVKTLTTKWDPSISDEADPGVAILKASCLLFDKVKYRQNYRNAQNSIREVTDPVEGEGLFYDLGYQIKKKKSASGNISVRYLNSGVSDSLVIPLFTQFTDSGQNITFTSIRKQVSVAKGETSLVEVQEGAPIRYEYFGRRIFTDDDLTLNLRLALPGYNDLASNGVIICSCSPGELSSGEETHPLFSDWLNIGDNVFTAVETSNLYSVGRGPDGVNYLQFYDESLQGLRGGIKIWIIGSLGSAGNIPSNRLNSISIAPGVTIDNSKVVISNSEFTNGQDQESLTSAMNNYYNSFGVNNSLVSARDYSQIIESIIGKNLTRMISKALVSDLDGYHNTVEIMTKDLSGKNYIGVKHAVSTLVTGILIHALKYSNDYYESFKMLSDPETLKFVKKALYRKNVISNDLSLVDSSNSIYNKYIFDLAELGGTVIVNTSDSEVTIKESIKSAIGNKFNSRNLKPGEMVSEIEIAEAVKKGVKGVIDCSFYYKDHSLFTDLDERSSLTTDEETSILARSVLKGDLPLFSSPDVLIPMGAYYAETSSGGTNYNKVSRDFPESGRKIKNIVGSFKVSTGTDGTKLERSLEENEFIQFYRESRVDYQTFGVGVKALLLAPQITLSNSTNLVSGNCLLLKNSVIKAGSVINSVIGGEYTIDGKKYGGISKEVANSGYFGENTGGGYKVEKDYTVTEFMAFEGSGSSLIAGSVISDGSFIDGEFKYALSLESGSEVNLSLGAYQGVVLRLKTGERSSDYTEIKYNTEGKPYVFRLENFTDGLKSCGSVDSPGNWGESFLTETIVTLVTDETVLEVSNQFMYGVISDHTFTDEDKANGYILGEGEHFIYSDSDLLDFVDFGSGTLLKGDLLKLTNRVTFDYDLAPQLERLDSSLELVNTEIHTFSKSSKNIEFIYYGIDQNLSPDWKKINRQITIEEDNKIIGTFGEDFKVRIGLILKSGFGNIVKFNENQKIEIMYDNGSKTEIVAPAGGYFISASEPLYLSSATTYDLTNSNLKISLYQTSSNNLTYNTSTGFTCEFDLSKSNPSYLRTNGESYLIKVENNSGGDLTLKLVTLTGLNGSGGTPGEDLGTGVGNLSTSLWSPNGNGGSSVTLNPGEVNYIYILKSESKQTGVSFSGSVTSGEVIIKSQTQIEGFNPDLKKNITGAEGNKILNEITKLTDPSIDCRIDFDYEYTSESQLKEPLDPIKFYDEQHILNKNILTVIDLEKLIDNIKITRRTR